MDVEDTLSEGARSVLLDARLYGPVGYLESDPDVREAIDSGLVTVTRDPSVEPYVLIDVEQR